MADQICVCDLCLSKDKHWQHNLHYLLARKTVKLHFNFIRQFVLLMIVYVINFDAKHMA